MKFHWEGSEFDFLYWETFPSGLRMILTLAHLLSFIYSFTGLQQKKSDNMASERSYIMIKPDGVARGLVGEIISRFEKRGFKLVAMKLKKVAVLIIN